ncbi:MAG: GNAT family N-acetyltransferase, partial [Deltaproteobacteria bacterium]|nr:GNAT family N-acetyltransferase [Deltaproteobacteria bacterium]
MDERVRDVFVTVLAVPREIVTPEATPEQVPGWDSLAHLSLVAEFERLFGVQLTMDEVLAVGCVGDFARLAVAGGEAPASQPPPAGAPSIDPVAPLLPPEHEALFDFARRVSKEITLVHSPEHWAWQYEQNPGATPGRSPVYLFHHEGAIAGHLGTIPVTLEAQGKLLRASWSAGLVTSPEARSRGAGVRLVERWTHDCDVSLVLGTTPDAEKLFTSLGWLRPAGGHLRSYMKLLDADAVVRKRVKNPAARKVLASVANVALSMILRTPSVAGGDLRVSHFDRFDARFDDFWERVRGGFPVIVRRDRRYLQWKFASQPGVEYIRLVAERSPDGAAGSANEKSPREVAGYAVLRIMKRKPYVAYIVDWLAGADDDEAWRFLLAASVDVLQSRGVQQIWCVVLNPTAEEHLRKFGFVVRDSPMTFFVRPNRPDLDPAFFTDGANWFV